MIKKVVMTYKEYQGATCIRIDNNSEFTKWRIAAKLANTFFGDNQNALAKIFGEHSFSFEGDYLIYVWAVTYVNHRYLILAGEGYGMTVEMVIDNQPKINNDESVVPIPIGQFKQFDAAGDEIIAFVKDLTRLIDPSHPYFSIKRKAGEHDWGNRGNTPYLTCNDCGIVRRTDKRNNPCRGIIKVGLRDEDK